jgi:hypothetical protein
MTNNIKITALTNIGANISYTTVLPVVNMTSTPLTQRANVQNLGNVILSGAGGSFFAPAAMANVALTVANAAQPAITSVGSLTSLNIVGNVRAGNANLGNLTISNFFQGDGSLLTNIGVARAPSYTVVGLPSATISGAGSLVYVSNAVGGPSLACSDGTNWRVISILGSVVS